MAKQLAILNRDILLSMQIKYYKSGKVKRYLEDLLVFQILCLYL
jgi:hypothetical protein